jgi:hypothetical protein
MKQRLAGVLSLAVFCLAGPALSTPGEPPSAPAWAVTGFGGVTYRDKWEDTFLDPAGLTFEAPGLAGVALARRVAAPLDGLSVELEGQVVRHFGAQTHWEVNAPIVTARWSRFPWSRTLDSSVAFGLGLSLTSEKPAVEVANEGDSEQAMAYWMIEVDTELPAEDWRLVGRVHHRSPAYGLFGDDGGANALVLGLRRRF